MLIDNMINEFRLRKLCLVIGVLAAIEFFVFGVGSVYVSAWNIDGSFSYPLPTAIFTGLFWGVMFVGSLLVIASYYRERVVISSTSLFQQRVFRNSTLKFNEIIQVKWYQNRNGGRVVLRTSDQQITINLLDFTDEDKRALVSLLRSAVAETIQEDCVRLTGTKAHKSWVVALVCSVMFAVIAGVCIRCWTLGMGLHWFLVGVCSVVASLWYLWRIRAFVSKPIAN